MNSVLDAPHFHNEEAAWAYVEARLWPDGPVCPHCGSMDAIGALNGKTTRFGLKKCYACKLPFTVRVGTIFEHSHAPMRKWLLAIYFIASSKKGVSSCQLARTLQVTVRTAWFMSHRVREAMQDSGSLMGGAGVTLETDETFWGKQANVFMNGKGWRTKTGTADMQKVVTMVERGGRARSIHVDSLQKHEIVRAMASADRASVLNTDQAQHYRRIGKEFADHQAVDHGREEYARYDLGTLTTTNSVEGFFSVFKRGMKGVYQHCEPRHLGRYLTEFDFRHSNRIRLGVDDLTRADRMLAGATGRRLTYKRLVHKPAA